MYEIFENVKDNQEIFEAYSNLPNYKVLDLNNGGGFAISSSHHTACFFQQLFLNFNVKLLKRINLNG